MLKEAILFCLLLAALSQAVAQEQPSKNAVQVEVVATASEYVPLSTTISHPGHSYTNCLGSTSFFGRFNTFGDSGSFSGTADTDTQCSTIFSPPTETTLTTYRRVNYTIAKDERALYLLSCTQTWKPTFAERLRIGILAAGPTRDSGAADAATANAKGTWSECPAFAIGAKYTLSVRNTSDARLESTSLGDEPPKNDKLAYLSSAALPPSPATESALQGVKVHVTSSPSGGEIYIDGKFFGSTPSEIAVPAGQHLVKVTIGGKEWLRSIEITAGEIAVHADVAGTAGTEAESLTQKTEVPVPSAPSTPPAPPRDAGKSPPDTLVTVSFTSDPDGAEINVDDSFVGKAPMTLQLKPGKHAVRMFMNDYHNWSQSITVELGAEEHHIAATLQRSN